MSIEIEKGIEIPEPRARNTLYPFRAMEVGDSFFVAGGDRTKVSTAAQWYQKTGGKRFSVRKVEGGLRVWRVE